MVESQRKVATPELYEKLIDRLGVALDAARTAGRLRDERPAELELRGLSPAEFELVKAYLEQAGHQTPPVGPRYSSVSMRPVRPRLCGSRTGRLIRML